MSEKKGMNADELDRILPRDFDRLAEAAATVQARMPGVGLFSVSKRLNCFFSVCHHLDRMINQGEIDLGESQIILIMLRMTNKSFDKAITIFDLRGKRSSSQVRSEMPRSAREYLAGIETYR